MCGELAQEYGAVFEQPDDFFVRVVARPVCDDVVHYADDPIGCDDDMVYFVRVYSDVFVVARGGVWADRYQREMLMVLADGLIALATLVLAILFSLGFREIWLFFVMAAIRAFGTGIQTPAVGAILPQIVPEHRLTRVNGLTEAFRR